MNFKTRLWRKNRNINKGSACAGVDLNRNFGYKWMTIGASSSQCSDVYAGPASDSELETKALQAAIKALDGRWDAYLTLHSYGQMWYVLKVEILNVEQERYINCFSFRLTPWGWTSSVPSDYYELIKKAQIAVGALNSLYGTQYQTGSSTNVLCE
jgi:hypothetical protein